MNLPTLTVLINGTDVTAFVLFVDGSSVSRGRADWQGAVTAGELSLTLNNSDGRFTPGASLGGAGFDTLPFDSGTFGGGSSSIAVDASIQLRETVNGVTYTRFTGFVKSWPISWPATVSTFATVQLTATDAQARAERRTLRSMLEEEVVLRSPSAYYTLAEATGSTSAGDSSGVGTVPLTIAGKGLAPTFGTAPGPGVDGLTATQFFGGKVLEGSGATFLPASAAWSVGAVFTVAAAPVSGLPIALWLDDTNLGVAGNFTYFNLDTSGRVSCFVFAAGAGGLTTSPGSICDGLKHTVIAASNGATLTLYVDGVAVASGPSAAPTRPLTRLAVGGPEVNASGAGVTATISNVSIWPSTLSAADALAISNAAAAAAEAGTSRLTRLAAFANIPVGTFDTSLTTVPAQPMSGAGAMDAIQAVSDAELGTTYMDGSGNLTFHNRNRVVAKTVPDLTLDHQWVTPDVQPVVDDQQIVNYFEATAQGTGGSTVVRNATSDAAHGRYPASQTYLVRTDQEGVDRANWIVANFAEPSARYGTLTINLAGMTPALASTVLAAVDLDCWLRVTSMAPQTPGGTTVDVVVEGYREQVSADTWTITCNVVSHALYAPVWRLGTSQLDTDTRLYV